MDCYSFKYKLKWNLIWSKLKRVKGHKYDPTTGKMIVFFTNGTIKCIGLWNLYDLYLGKDWVDFNIRQAQNEAGQPVSFNVEK